MRSTKGQMTPIRAVVKREAKIWKRLDSHRGLGSQASAAICHTESPVTHLQVSQHRQCPFQRLLSTNTSQRRKNVLSAYPILHKAKQFGAFLVSIYYMLAVWTLGFCKPSDTVRSVDSRSMLHQLTLHLALHQLPLLQLRSIKLKIIQGHPSPLPQLPAQLHMAMQQNALRSCEVLLLSSISCYFICIMVFLTCTHTYMHSFTPGSVAMFICFCCFCTCAIFKSIPNNGYPELDISVLSISLYSDKSLQQ